MGEGIGLPRNPEFAWILQVEALIKRPSLSRNTAAIAPDPAPWQNAPSVLHFSRSIGGGFQKSNSFCN
ncbi:hypothetical protein PIB30_026705 [Stylosanthes scabra]|uniref:Ycf15 n=1 Tax=Stylosanthes scabra TaxID=79078 RepID=A0ABU6SAJ3_9FABA|nr:hypothetical protein [Stylosanthes scabra]